MCGGGYEFESSVCHFGHLFLVKRVSSRTASANFSKRPSLFAMSFPLLSFEIYESIIPSAFIRLGIHVSKFLAIIRFQIARNFSLSMSDPSWYKSSNSFLVVMKFALETVAASSTSSNTAFHSTIPFRV